MLLGVPYFDLLSLWLLGVLGVGHCIGMCGPLVLAFPGRAGGLSSHLAYHAGRIAVYTMLGILLGALGGVLGHLGAVARLQVALSALAALFLLLFGLARIGLVKEPRILQLPSSALDKGTRLAGLGDEVPRWLVMIALGAVNGLLPCGLSYAALVRALPSGGPIQGGLLVVAFGLGTLPGLLILGTAASGFLKRHRAMSDILAGVLMIGMAVSLGLDVLQSLL
jgi:sulfite exporter TauE/SafE